VSAEQPGSPAGHTLMTIRLSWSFFNSVPRLVHPLVGRLLPVAEDATHLAGQFLGNGMPVRIRCGGLNQASEGE